MLSGAGLTIRTCSESDDAAYKALLCEADALWHVLQPVTRQAIERAPNLRLIQKIGVGVNTIDLEAARSSNITVCNMPGTNSRAVAELTLALMLACLRRLVPFDRATKEGGGWSWPVEWQEDLAELGGKTVGLAGFGAVATILAPVLAAMGAEVIYTSRRRKPEVAHEYVSKHELLVRSDLLSLHMPLMADTENWLDLNSIRKLKRGAIVINVARGGLIQEDALAEALRKGALRGAGLDVFRTEPIQSGDPLLTLPNVVTLPHVAWLTRETIERSLAIAVENTRRAAVGIPLMHRVA